MPNEEQHIQWALHNIDVINHLYENQLFCDWVATVAFYTGLHIIEAVLFADKGTQGKHGVDHHRRKITLKQTNRFLKLYQHYRPLHSAAQVARYIEDSAGTPTFFQSYMSATEVRDTLLQHHLVQIMKSAMKFLCASCVSDLKMAINNLP